MTKTVQGTEGLRLYQQVPATDRCGYYGLPMRYINLAQRAEGLYVARLTNWEGRNSKVPLDFLARASMSLRSMPTLPPASNATPITSTSGRWTHDVPFPAAEQPPGRETLIPEAPLRFPTIE